MSIDFTVAIPTYNGETRLPKVIEYLRSQTDIEHISWEILVVDNNSSDHTAKVVQEYQANWQQSYPLRYCFEAEQGLAFARQRAIEEARGEFIGFLDDDNLCATDWVSAAYQFGKEHPQVGAYGGKIQGSFEVEPPENLKAIIFYLALVDRGSQSLQYQPRKNGVPPGAGLVVRRQVWQEHVPSRLLLVGRAGNSLLSGSDFEPLLHIHRAGWEIWYNPAMSIEHVIPAKRLDKSYLLPLMRGIGLSRHHLRMLSLDSWQRPGAFLLYLVNDTRKLLWYFLQHRMVIKSDVVAACEMERLLGTLISPFYLWKLRLKSR